MSWNKNEGDAYTPRNVLMSSIILAPSLVNQKKEAIVSYCEKRASRISTIEAKKIPRWKQGLTSLMRDLQAIVVKRKKSPYMQQRIVNGPRAFSDFRQKV